MEPRFSVVTEPVNLNRSDTANALSATAQDLLGSATQWQRVIIRLLAAADSEGVTMADKARIVRSLGAEYSTRTWHECKAVADAIESSANEADAFESLGNQMDPSVTLAWRLAQDNGTLPQLRQAIMVCPVGDPVSEQRTRSPASGVAFWQFIIVAQVFFFFMLKIMPTLEQLFIEFDLALPEPMRVVIGVSNYIYVAYFPAILLFIGCFILCQLFVEPTLVRRWNPMTWRDRVFPKRSVVRRQIAIACDLSGTVDLLGRIHAVQVAPNLRRRIAGAIAAMGPGRGVWAALRDNRILTARETGAMETSGSDQARAWILRRQADAIEASRDRKIFIAVRLFDSVTTIAMGAFVVFVAISVSLMMSSLLQGLLH